MRAAMLVRSDSIIGSPATAGDQYCGAGASFLRRCRSTKICSRSGFLTATLHLDARNRREGHGHLLRRARSEADLIGSENPPNLSGFRSPIPARVAEEEEEELKLKEYDLGLGVWKRPPATAAPAVLEEVEYSGGGIGKGGIIGGGWGGGDGNRDGSGDPNEKKRIGEYYLQMLRSDPTNPLLLMNYGKFLHEVEGDAKGAEEYYSRAILASPGDGEVLSLYGKLVWETNRDGERAEAYFERAVEASPNDCYVLGSYARFLWDAEEEEETVAASSPLVEAF